jgi:hypothetical protein
MKVTALHLASAIKSQRNEALISVRLTGTAGDLRRLLPGSLSYLTLSLIQV